MATKQQPPDLRGLFLTMRASDLRLSATRELPHVWGGMMELAFPKGVASLVAAADGTASLYLSSGGAVIGGHAHESVRVAVARFLATLESAIGHFAPATTFPAPTEGWVGFVVRTYEGERSAQVAESELGSGRHALSASFEAGHEVITALRLIAEPKMR